MLFVIFDTGFVFIYHFHSYYLSAKYVVIKALFEASAVVFAKVEKTEKKTRQLFADCLDLESGRICGLPCEAN
jgi:hypothetical protein